jgi:hypothetical protein
VRVALCPMSPTQKDARVACPATTAGTPHRSCSRLALLFFWPE